jgi:hypothetical protein
MFDNSLILLITFFFGFCLGFKKLKNYGSFFKKIQKNISLGFTFWKFSTKQWVFKRTTKEIVVYDWFFV